MQKKIVQAFYQSPRCTKKHKLLYNGTVYIFDEGGMFESTDTLKSEHTYQIVDVNVISVLSAKDTLSLGVSFRSEFADYLIKGTTDIALNTMLFGLRKHITLLTRKINQNGVRGTQTLYVYPKTVNPVEVLNEVKNALAFTVEG